MNEGTKVLDVIWFSAQTLVGIVRVADQYDGIKYYIGSPPYEGTNTEAGDAQWIADWGARFPTAVGDVLFGVKS